MKYDYLIVGTGFAGTVVAERIASRLDKKVLVIDRRNHIGGNCFDYLDDNGIIVHKYGPHIFHTNSKKVWDYISGFTNWNIYFHNVLAVVEGKKIPLPFNLNSLYNIFPKKFAENLEKLMIDKFGYGVKIPILKMLETSDNDLKFLAEFIYKNVFLGYTIKQWGLKPEELDFSVSSRVPVFISRDDRYFQDTYQGIPSEGYTSIFEKMLNHPNIELRLNCGFNDIKSSKEADKIIYTGMIDEYFDNIFGELPYRSLNFEFKSFSLRQYQETAQVNYPNNYDFTRTTEFKHFLPSKSESTTVAFEFPQQFVRGLNEPYYPIPSPENELIVRQYQAQAEKIANNVQFIGRLAEYKYYNMDQIVGVALSFFENKIVKKLF